MLISWFCFNVSRSYHSSVSMCYVHIIALIYQGGMKAVIWSDVFQTAIMLTGMLACIIQVTHIIIVCIKSIKTRFKSSVDLMFGHRRRRWQNIKSTIDLRKYIVS